MKQARKLVYSVLFCSILMMALACASTDRSDTENPTLSVSQEEFVEGIAKPIIELMAIFGGYYHDNATWPRSLPTLQRYAENKKMPLHAQGIKNWQVSDLPQETDITFQIVSPASLGVSGQVTTMWGLTQNKLTPDNLALKALTPFCILHQQPDSVGDILLRLTVSTIVRRPMQPSGNRLCFRPATADIKVRQKEEQVNDRLRLRLQQMEQQRQKQRNQPSQ